MPSFYQDNHIELYAKDCRQMTELADNSVQCVVTSPPYWGLRKYSGEQELIWGIKTNPDGTHELCNHQWGVSERSLHSGSTKSPLENRGGRMTSAKTVDAFCSLCGAWKGAYGLEPTPEMYVQHTIEILREIRRVLREDGVVFWNIGDSYATHASGSKKTGHNFRSAEVAAEQGIGTIKRLYGKNIGLKEKDLCLIPFRIAISAQTDGWWVRSVIIWSKPNPMPESVTDRPTESHEYILMLTKSAKYYWDADAVREESICTSFGSDQRDTSITHGVGGGNSGINEAKRRAREQGSFGGRNIRTVWEFPTQPYPEAHFAVFPEKLPELCIKAATPEVGCCSKCGAPWERIIERGDLVRSGKGHISYGYKGGSKYQQKDRAEISSLSENFVKDGLIPGMAYENKTIGWQPTCKCNADKVPSLVLDPFAGAGTTLWVAKKLNRQAVGYEISEEYCELALERNRQQVLL